MSLPRVGCLLLPGFSLGTLAGAVDTLAAAMLRGAGAEPVLLSLDGRAVRSHSGAWVAAGALHQAPPLQMAMVVADAAWQASDPTHADVTQWLRQQAAAGVALAGVGTGAAWLAEAGLLKGYRATLHWPHLAALAERHPEVVLSQQRFEIDRDRLTSAGSEAARDLMIAWLGRLHGDRLAHELAGHAGLAAPRSADERQRVPGVAQASRGTSAKLAEALALMEANLAEPLSTEDIASLVGVSRRHLERLFRQHLDALPSRWYLGLRLERARQLLRQTPQSVLQIGLACGFASGPHFSNAYRAHFGHTPRDERGARAQAWRERGPVPQGASPAATGHDAAPATRTDGAPTR